MNPQAPDPAEIEREALARLERVHGPAELRAAILALIATPDHTLSMMAWSAETQDVRNAQSLQDEVARLREAARLPCLEAMLDRMRAQSKDDRRQLLQSTRRVVAAISPLRPIDRLHWLMMRRRLGERAPVPLLPDAHNDLIGLPMVTKERIATVAAYLARIVPGPDAAAGQAWYAAAMAHLLPPARVPPYRAPDGETLAFALLEVESLPWMLRPVLLRAWTIAALGTQQRARLLPMAADALRLLGDLLDSPLPPVLARHYTIVEWAKPR